MLDAAARLFSHCIGFDTNAPLIRHIRSRGDTTVFESHFDAALIPAALRGLRKVFALSHVIEHLARPLTLVDTVAASMAAGKINAQQLRSLDEVCRLGYQANDVKSITRFLDANKALHIAIAEATGNGRLAAMIAQLLDQMTRLLHLGLGLRTRAQQATHEHRALLKALTRGDGEAAQRISREEIEATRGMVLSAIMTSNTVMNLAITGD